MWLVNEGKKKKKKKKNSVIGKMNEGGEFWMRQGRWQVWTEVNMKYIEDFIEHNYELNLSSIELPAH